MPRRHPPRDTEAISEELVGLIAGFRDALSRSDLRTKVFKLVPVVHSARALGISLIPAEGANAARDRILAYFKKYPLTLISGDELLIVSGIGEWARRVRELRGQMGWSIVSGGTLRQMHAAGENFETVSVSSAKVTDYVLVTTEQDRDAAHRWHTANEIRNRRVSIRDRILAFLQANIGSTVTGEELRYVAKGGTEWARRVRELRTEHGWQIATRITGRPDLPVGTYTLESADQLEEHDRHISDEVRAAVLERDKHRCTDCGWDRQQWSKTDPRHLILHHIQHHARRGENSVDNLRVLCNSCHYRLHRRERHRR